MSAFSEDLQRRIQDIDNVADTMVKKVQNMKKEMNTKKEVRNCLYFSSFSVFKNVVECNSNYVILFLKFSDG